MLALFLTACGLKSLLPEGPVLDAGARAAFVVRPSGAAYRGPAQVDFPVLPVIVWGAAYDLDLVLVSEHPEWNMHEYARLQTPDGPLWLAKDARESTMAQSVVADLPDVQDVLPELPIERRASPVEVVDRSTDAQIDLELRYRNIDGKPVEIRYRGKWPEGALRRRNGNTMGHSRDSVLAALDIPQRQLGQEASVRIDGEDVKMERILGLVPFRLALVQTQGGLATGTLRQEPLEGGGFTTVHAPGGGPAVRRAWRVARTDGHVEAQQVSTLRSLAYRFRLTDDGAHELVSARVEQWARDVPVTQVVFSPALPDLARPFDGTVRARFVIDVNGQPGHATGLVEAWWEEGEPRVQVLPEAPSWTTDRPLSGRWTFRDGATDAVVVVDRSSVE